MLQVCIKIAYVFLFFSIAQIKCCKREDLHYVRITENPTQLDHGLQVFATFSQFGFYASHSLILASEGLSPCENIQEYEEKLKHKASIIEIHGHSIPVIQQGDVQNLVNIVTLRLEGNFIEQLQPGAFLNVPNLTTVDLSNNSIKEVQKGIFNNMNINVLNLSHNKISIIAPGAFDNMPNLFEIDLGNNLLTTWNSNWLTNAPNLEILLVKSNELSAIPKGAFSNIKDSLRILNLANNKMDVIDAAAIEELKKLEKLYLENNKFSCLSDDVLNAFPERLALSIAPNDNIQCLCWSKLEKWAFKYYPQNKDTIFFTVRLAEIQCNEEIVGLLHNTLSRISALEKH